MFSPRKTAEQTSARNMNRFAGSLLAMLLTFLAGFSWQSWQAEKTLRSNELGSVLEFGSQFVEGYLERMDLRLRRLSLDLSEQGKEISPDKAMVQFNRFIRSDIANLWLIRANGDVVASTSAPVGQHFSSLASGKSFGKTIEEMRLGKQLSIGQAMDRSADDIQIIPLHYAIRDSNGELTYVIVVDLRLAMLQDFWRTSLVSQETVLGLMQNDGTLLNLYQANAGFQAEENSGKPRINALTDHLRQAGFYAGAQMQIQRSTDSEGQLSVFRPLTNYPVTMFISTPMSSIRMGWWRRVQVPFLLSFILIGCGIAAHRLILKNQRIREEEQSRMQELLRISNERWKLALEFAGDGMWEVNCQSGDIKFSKHSLEMLGYVEGELGNRLEQWIDQVPPEDRLRVEYAIQAYSSGKTSEFQVEHRALCKDGQTKWFLVRGNALSRDMDGRPVQLLGTLTDITKRKMAFKQLQESELRLRQGFILFPTGVAVVSDEGKVIEANPALCRMFGCDEEEIMGASLELFFRDNKPNNELLDLEPSEEGQISSSSLERTAIRKDGYRFPVIYTLSAIYNPADRLPNYIVRIEDLSERKRTQLQEVAQGILVAQEQDRARISHELHDEIGQSLTALKITLKRAQQYLSDPEKAESCLTNGQQMLEKLMVEVRGIAYGLRPAEIDQLGLVSALRSLLDKTFRPLGLNAVLSENIGETRLPASLELCCFRVIQEALTNCLRHAKTTRLEASLMYEPERLVISVKDDGVGFDISHYYSSREESKSLGLVGMHERVAANDGQLQIRSSPGRGTEIIATFNIARAAW